ncbi:hypothetical protein AHAS_Ahas06G0155500 [Arachis hypogaea]
MKLEGMKASMNLNNQTQHQTQQHMGLRDGKVDGLQSAAVNAKFPPWRPHSYLRMGEARYQEQRSFNQGKSMTTNNQHHLSTSANQSQYSQNTHCQTHSNWRRTENQNHEPRNFNYNNPNFSNHKKYHYSNNNHYMPPSHPLFQPLTSHNQPISQDSQRITDLEILIERMMKHQEETTRNQEMLIRGIEEQIAQLAKYFAEMGEKKPNTFLKTIEDKPTNNEDATKKE